MGVSFGIARSARNDAPNDRSRLRWNPPPSRHAGLVPVAVDVHLTVLVFDLIKDQRGDLLLCVTGPIRHRHHGFVEVQRQMPQNPLLFDAVRRWTLLPLLLLGPRLEFLYRVAF